MRSAFVVRERALPLLKEQENSRISLTVRSATRDDIATVVGMANAFNATLGKPDDRYSVARLSELVFGKDAFVHILVASAVSRVRGYATYHRAFDPFLAAPALWLADLYVQPEWRGRGFGAALMAGLASEVLKSGAESLWWGVDRDNEAGQRFYRRLGATDINDSIFVLQASVLTGLALAHEAKEELT